MVGGETVVFPLVDIEVTGRLKNLSYVGESGNIKIHDIRSRLMVPTLLLSPRSGGGAVCMSRLMMDVGDFEIVLTFKATKIINKEVPLQ